MMTMAINERPFYYALVDHKEPIIDEYGNEADTRIVYKTPVLAFGNITEARNAIVAEPFGNLEEYDKVIITDWMDCPITDDTVLCVDCAPEYSEDDDLLYDYVVRRVAKSLNSVAIAIAKVLKT